MRKSLLSLLMLLLIAAESYAQSGTVSGLVTDQNSQPVEGATVAVVETQKSAISDSKGHFKIAAANGQTLKISYIGATTSTIKVDATTGDITVKLELANTSLNEVVVTGYQTQRKADLTGAVAVVDLKKIKDIPSGNPMQSLQGQVPGLYIETNGTPSGATSRVLIRGLNTLGNTNPLYIIDGVPTKRPEVFQNLDPNSIQSVQVLKDAAAASIYGSRSSNGVIIVTTKEGKGKTRLQFNSSITAQRYTSKLPVLNTIERGRALWQASINDGTSPTVHSALYTYTSHTDANGTPVLDGVNVTPFLGNPSLGVRSANTDWQDEVFRTGLVSSNNLTVSSGSEKSNLFIDLAYFSNSGLVRYSDYKRFSGQINSSVNLFNNVLKIGENVQLSKSAETPLPTDLGGQNILQVTKFLQPIIPVYDDFGNYSGPTGSGFSDRNNPLHMLYINRNDKNNLFNTFGNVYAELKPLKGLTFRSTFGFDYADTFNKNIEETFTEGNLSRTVNSLSYAQGHQLNLTFTNALNYNLEFGLNRFSFLLGNEAIKEQFVGFGAYREGFAIQDADYFYLDAGTGRSTNNGGSTGNQLLSYFGKVNYSFADKYLASATVRRDGSSRFGLNNRFAYFPAATLGYRLSSEKFFKENITFISDLKLRASAGRVGNQEIGDNASYGLYQTNYGTVVNNFANTGTAYDLGGTNSGSLPSGYVSTQAANPNLRWETTDELNLGVDFEMLDNKLSGSFDYFTRKTKDILVQPPTAGIQGEGRRQYVNGATKTNKGFEAALTYHNNIGALNYSLTGNVTAFYDKITYLPNSVISAYPGNVEQTILGQSQTAIFGYVVDGIFQNQQQVQNSAAQPGKGVGRLRYADLNNDGKIDPLDQRFLGNQLPDFSYGFGANLSYKNFSLAFFFQGVQGISVYNGVKAQTDFVGTAAGVNYGRRVLDAWTPQNTSSTIPAVSLIDANNETRSSTYFIENGSYLKLRNLQLGYNIPHNIIKRLAMEELRVFVLGENLFTIKDNNGANKFTAPDPENPSNLYPRPTRFTFGINVTF